MTHAARMQGVSKHQLHDHENPSGSLSKLVAAENFIVRRDGTQRTPVADGKSLRGT